MTSTSGSFVRNSVYNLLGQVLPLLIGLCTIPTLVHTLGMDRFGLLSLVWVFLGYMTFLDLGLSRAVIKLVAEDLAKARHEDAPRTVWTASWIAFALSVVGALALVSLSESLSEDLFKIPPSLHDEATGALRWIALSLPILTITAIFRGTLEAQQRFFAANIIQALASSLTYLIPWLALLFTHSVETLIALITLGRSLSLIVTVLVVWRSTPGLFLALRPHLPSARRLVDFGTWMTVSNLISPLMVYFDRFILGTLLPLANLAYYTTPYEVVSRTSILPSAISRVLFPLFSATHAVERERGRQMLIRSLKMVGFFFLPVCALLIIIAPWGLKLWLGEDFSEKSTPILQIFSFGIFFNGLASVPFTFLQGTNRPDITAKIHLLELPFYVGALWFLTSKFGLQGAASAWALRMIFDFVLLWTFSIRGTAGHRHVIRPALILSLVFTSVFISAFTGAPLIWSLILFAAGLFLLWAYLLNLSDRLLVLPGGAADPHLPQSDAFIAAIVISYHPDESFLKNIEAIRSQFDAILVVDNGSTGHSRETLKALERNGLEVIWNPKNMGIATALNQGFSWAEKQGAEWVASFDQDSCPPRDFRARMQACLRKAVKQEGSVALAGPVVHEMAINRVIERRSDDTDPCAVVDVPMVITSGSFSRIDCFRQVGGFDDGLFIDYVDHDYALRLRRRGYRVIECHGVSLQHHLGDSKTHNFILMSFFASHHSPLRRYYNTRNRFRIYVRSFMTEPDWVLEDLVIFFKEVTKIILVESQKAAKLGNILRGLFDFALWRQGPRGGNAT